jgi:hypothetical protein
LDHQVVGQNDAMALPDLADFMVTIGIERDEGETIAGPADEHLFIMVLDRHCAAAGPTPSHGILSGRICTNQAPIWA